MAGFSARSVRAGFAGTVVGFSARSVRAAFAGTVVGFSARSVRAAGAGSAFRAGRARLVAGAGASAGGAPLAAGPGAGRAVGADSPGGGLGGWKSTGGGAGLPDRRDDGGPPVGVVSLPVGAVFLVGRSPSGVSLPAADAVRPPSVAGRGVPARGAGAEVEPSRP
jgi:hypothetical protein